MIIVRLKGGLGNQMFQYATGRRLALRLETELKLDLSWLERSRDREFALGPFPIRATAASEREVRRLAHRPRPVRILRRLLGRPPTPPASHVKERNLRFDPGILDLGDGVYLDGYWQSERYFDDAAETIRAELSPPEPISSPDREVAACIDGVEAVSVHVRRGDYVSSTGAQKTLEPADLDYYRRAVATLTPRLRHPHLFVFSDEPDWARQHLALSLPTTVVDHNGTADAYRDLALMARCRHHVIANSSFSWWGAWLSLDPGKIVIAPSRWFSRDDLHSTDLVPGGWTKL